jgi:hypothetical protein
MPAGKSRVTRVPATSGAPLGVGATTPAARPIVAAASIATQASLRESSAAGFMTPVSASVARDMLATFLRDP